jgi:hypothetical protein
LDHLDIETSGEVGELEFDQLQAELGSDLYDECPSPMMAIFKAAEAEAQLDQDRAEFYALRED